MDKRVGVGVALPLRERAEPAAGVADVGEVDVAVDHERNIVADHLAAQRIRQCGNSIQGRAVGGRQGQILVVGAAGRIVLGRPQCGQHVGVDALGRACREFVDLLADRLPVPERAAQIAARLGPPSLEIDRRVQVRAAQRLGRLVGLLPRTPDRVDVARQPGVRVGQRHHVPVHPRVDPRGAAQHVRRLRGQPLHQVIAGLGGHVGQLVQRGPGSLRVDVIGRQRRHPAPVVDPGADQRQAFGARHQIRRRLDAHLGSQHQPGDGHRRQKLLDAGVGHRGHRGVFLGPEVLHDHFLDVPELLVRPADRVHGLGALGQVLADTDQQPGGERDGQPARIVERAQPHLGVLVRAAVVGQAFGLEQPPRRGLQHHPHRWGHRLEARQFRPAHHARVQVRQQAGLLQHPDGHRPHVVQRGVIASLVEPLAGFGPPSLRSVAEREKCFLATQFGTTPGHVEDVVGLHVHAHPLGAQLARHGDERAVVAGVAA